MSTQDQDQSLSDADKIRLKRLARLGTATTPLPSASTPEATPQKPQAAAPKPTPQPASANALGKRPAEAAAPAPIPINIKPARPSLPYPQWETSKIQAVFAVTLSRMEAEQSGWELCWLKGLEQELRTEPTLTPSELADRLIIARLSLEPAAMASSDDPDILTVLAGLRQDETVFEYLAGCWKRLQTTNKEANTMPWSADEKTAWAKINSKLKGLIVSYIGMTLEDPSMFPQPANKPLGPREFLPILLSTATPSAGDPLTASQKQTENTAVLSSSDLLPFLNDLAANISSDTLAEVLSPTLSFFFQQWFSISPAPDLTGSEWQRYIGAISALVQVKSIAAIIPTLGVWASPSADAFKIEYQSLLGPLARLSVYPREFVNVWRTYFSEPTERKVADIDANKGNLRQTLGALQTSLFLIFNAIIRSNPAAREKVLDYFATVARLNTKRAGMGVDYRTVSSDGYMTNLQMVLLKLFEPVMDSTYSKIDKVDAEFFKLSQRIDISEETRIKGNKEEVDQYAAAPIINAQPPNFISDLFFLLNSYQHLGLVKTIGNRARAEKNLSDSEKEFKRTEAARPDWAGNAALEAQGEAAINKHKGDIATLHASIHAYDTQLLDPALTRINLTFIDFVMTWLVRQVDPRHQHPHIPISLPLPAESPVQFRMLPEYLFDNIAEYLAFLSRYNPDALDDTDKKIVITFVLTFMSRGYVNNPFVKAKLVQTLANGLYPVGYWRHGPLFDRLNDHEYATEHLMSTLIRFFIDVEMTGGHTQFWDKFNFRRDISRIIKAMWPNPLHRVAFVKSRHDDFDQFIRFINMLMSDTTFHLEESLTGLAKINHIEAMKTDTAAWQALPKNERDDLKAQLEQAESQTPYHTSMGLDHVELIKEFTATAREPFVTQEIVDRLAASLNENLSTLVGPKMADLKVADPARFSFKPKRLLAGLAQIYINLASETDFVRAVANDGRSYSKELFERFARTLKNRAIMPDAEVAGIVAFARSVEAMRATILLEDEREIPDEFLDPLLATLMKDPVILPISRVVIDRGTIRAALLSKEFDPFNNMPLKYEDLVPDTELKAKIDAWLAETNSKQAEDMMDVDDL